MRESSITFKMSSDLVQDSQDEKILEFAKEELKKMLPALLKKQIQGISVVFAKPKGTLRFDGYHIVCSEAVLRIEALTARGVLHGAYEALRRLGCDFIFPGEKRQMIPKNMYDRLPTFEVRREPWIEYRGLCLYNTTKETLAETRDAIDWMAKNGFNLLLTSIHRLDDSGQGDHAILWDEIGAELLPEIEKRGIVLDMSEHSTDHYFPKEALFREHPEWFSLLQGKRCPGQICYSNAEAVEAYGDSLAEFVKGKEEFRFFGIWPLDGGGYCECDACRDPLTIYRANKRIAAKIAAVRPDLIVEHLAYTPQSFSRPQEAMPENMSVLVCSVRDKIAYEWAQRAKAGGGAFYFDYNTGDHYRWRAQTWLNPYYCREMVNTMAAYGYRGIVSLYLPVTCWWQASINYWYLRHFYYEPTADVRELTDELAGKLFGVQKARRMAKLLMRIYNELQAPEIWSRDPHMLEGFREHITGRNRDLDAVHRKYYERVMSEIEQELKEITVGAKGKANFWYLLSYLKLQRLYYVLLDQFDADTDAPEMAEAYFEELAKLKKNEDDPFISAEYARWRIAGRDSILCPEAENAFQAAADDSPK